ncbi:hypothetical protein A2303_00430 [Candidatus Falkowbacteria bacterium RIFOXYB2_FULL_47_14]|uniref:Amino acid transporter transmembrane domain-containing protein n=1 Tax=Candidatus Falkowbacteria bacterium RIFOXYA2_FULL_47_19 TaxID=1797994 RepID=A0A1F5SN83_9BACT|nr:MAG: hypothetical protein A2227_03835 [Candidatus Falkowbacteria bacterium RIFOXYA2_FULL_47_19]OGF37341.1 MAG: hypothetical protein A2468_02195 [Candidatus Falkowbacteria bacterium RIFOXYC2_FULL_46_15]OGF42843.1 MAG: hypothetical protein A2303_00430 [Candidatus Falkowbacteria bacterium RIFOXYB2_FULL_47_14]
MLTSSRHKNYYKAIAVMVGYIIGVGMFGLPFVVAKAGLLTFFGFLLFLGPIQYFLHLVYANIICVSGTSRRLPGYATEYLGKKYKIFVLIAKMTGNFGGLLAYIIITGIFLHELFSPYFGGSEFVYASVLFALEAVVVYFGIGMIAKVELVLTAFLLLMPALIAWKGWGEISAVNYSLLDWKYILLPYGVMLFSLDGNGSMPIISKLLDRDRKSIKSVIRIGTFLPVVVIIIFTLVIVGISGSATTEDALVGVKQVLNDGVVFFSLIFGVLTMITSFFGVSESVKEILNWDYGVGKKLSWAIAVFVPYLMYITGARNLVDVIGFVGSIGSGFCGIVLILIFRKLQKQEGKLVLFDRQPGNFITSFFILMFLGGIVYNLIYYFIVK